MAIVILFIVHWQLSVFCQSFFLHRYGAHQQFTMSKGWEKFFNFLTAVAQNSSYLNPRGYAVLHRMHHAYSDTPKDPHTPVGYKGIVPGLFKMMWKTKRTYHEIAYYEKSPEARFDGTFPQSRLLEWMGKSWVMRFVWGAAFFAFYYFFATATWQWVLLPGHWIMGAMHGAIVNWGGHRYGYRNFNNDDVSRNSLPIDVLTGGELYQNNHHKYPMSPNFAARWFELDTTYQVMKLFNFLGIIRLKGTQTMRFTSSVADAATVAVGADVAAPQRPPEASL